MKTNKIKIITILMFVIFALSTFFNSASAIHYETGRVFGLSAQYLDPESGGYVNEERLAYYINLSDGPKVVYKIVQKK